MYWIIPGVGEKHFSRKV